MWHRRYFSLKSFQRTIWEIWKPDMVSIGGCSLFPSRKKEPSPHRLWINRMAWGQGVLTYLLRLNAPPSQSPFCQGECGWLGTRINLCNKVQRSWTWSLWIYQRAADLSGGGGRAGGPPPQCENATVCITDIFGSWGEICSWLFGLCFSPETPTTRLHW